MEIAAFLPAPLLAQLRSALAGHHLLTAADSWDTLDAIVRRNAVDLAVIDPAADGTVRVGTIADMLERYPSLPLVLYTALSPRSMKAVVELSRRGAQQVVLHRFDDDPKRLRAAVAWQANPALSDVMLEELTPQLGALTPALAKGVEQLFRRPQRFFSAQDLARASGVTVRTVYRQFGAAGLDHPRRVVNGARVLRGYVYLRDPGHTMEDVAAKLGYRSRRIFSRQMFELVGLHPRALRRRMTPDEFVRRLADRLRTGVA